MNGMGVMGIFLMLMLAALFFLPTVIAVKRKHPLNRHSPRRSMNSRSCMDC